ncbi:bile acid:sodium symporter [Synechococcus sp. CS-1329]|uniref:bile acid:sodium symporter n=1 Tax=Synechococcus sp. CS-1329 TaxID=2847975 RepID=UPI00223BD27D|nr:bile acid:sodium symporter [Synechococcus sp. CS-1329]MCT0218297.1 bile acid:sodium symporter [Synechococcus sp. CS-1329]
MSGAAAALVGLTLFSLMFSLGLSLELDGSEMRKARRRPGVLIRVLIGSCLLVPLLALLLLASPPGLALAPPARFGIALMALCPSAPLAMRKARTAGGASELAALLQVSAALLAVASIPLMAQVFRHSFAIEGWELRPEQVMVQISQVQLLPLLCGIALRRWQPALTHRFEGTAMRLANALLVLLVVLFLVALGPDLLAFVIGNGPALLVMALMTLGSLGLGALLAGRDPIARTTVPLVTSMRNPGLALLFAGIHGGGMPEIKTAILAYLLVTILVSIPFVSWRKKRRIAG